MRLTIDDSPSRCGTASIEGGGVDAGAARPTTADGHLDLRKQMLYI
jgi:hypothetical protein